jgi:hypothetical protein
LNSKTAATTKHNPIGNTRKQILRNCFTHLKAFSHIKKAGSGKKIAKYTRIFHTVPWWQQSDPSSVGFLIGTKITSLEEYY